MAFHSHERANMTRAEQLCWIRYEFRGRECRTFSSLPDQPMGEGRRRSDIELAIAFVQKEQPRRRSKTHHSKFMY